MATINWFDQFAEDVHHGVHDFGNDTFMIALTNTAPVATNAVLTDITEIAYTNLTGDRILTVTSSGQTSGTYKFAPADETVTASGVVATFRYVVLYNDTPTSPLDPLICWYDRGSTIDMVSPDTFTTDFSEANGLFQATYS